MQALIKDSTHDMNIEELWQFIKNTIHTSIQTNVCLVRSHPTNTPLWLNQDVKAKLRRRKHTRTIRSAVNYECYKKAQNEANAAHRKAEVDYEVCMAHKIKKDPRFFYKYIHKRISKPTSMIS